MADEVTALRKSLDPMTDSSGGFLAPVLPYNLNFSDIGSYGLRQYSGWIREEYLPQLMGRQAITMWREMMDNSSIIGSMLFAITQAMRKVEWRVETPDDRAESKREQEFADSLRLDMSHTWEDFVAEALSMLPFGFSAHEIVYKRRMGLEPTRSTDASGPDFQSIPSSEYNDGRIGWRRLPIRSQDTILKWFFDLNGQIKGLTQQPWIGTLIDIPIEKLLLFRPTLHKNNPEGRSILRTAYRDYYYVKRMEEMESVLFERMAGFPVIYAPMQLLDAAKTDPNSAATLLALKSIVTNARINEQMGIVLPSDTYRDADGKTSAVKMYSFELLTPQHGRGQVDIDKVITRHQVNMLMTVLCDFIQMGHEVRGTNNLGTMKVDMFYNAIEGYLDAIAAVMNRYALPRIWKLNALDYATMPQYKPDMPQRLDLDGLGNFIKNIAQSGMPLFPDDELEGYLRDAAGLPEVDESQNPQAIVSGQIGKPQLEKMLRRAMAREILKMRQAA